MDGLCRVIGAGTTIEIRGVTYRLAAMTLEDWGIVENRILQQKRNAILTTIADQRDCLPADVWRAEWKAACERAQSILRVSYAEAEAGVATDEGMAFRLWLMLEKHYPSEFSYDDLLDIVGAMTELERFLAESALAQAAAIDRASWDLDWPRKGEGSNHTGAGWRFWLWQVTRPVELGGLGLSPESAKRLTFYEARLYTSAQEEVGGTRKMDLYEARKFCRSKMANREPKKWPDRKKRMAELYEKRFGKPMPEDMLKGL